MLDGNPYDANCPTRRILDRIGDRWTVLSCRISCATSSGTGRSERPSEERLPSWLRDRVGVGAFDRMGGHFQPKRPGIFAEIRNLAQAGLFTTADALLQGDCRATNR